MTVKHINGFVLCLLFCGICQTAWAQEGLQDWPMYGYDASRSSKTPHALPDELSLKWVFQNTHAPRSAWLSQERMAHDRVFQPIVGQGNVFFGSSADDQVLALDLKSGKVVWTFFTEGPVRFAPVFWKDRILVASDDGFLYALGANDGALLWKRHVAGKPDLIFGNQRLISKWPVRSGPVVFEDTVYVGAGIWPNDGFFLKAFDPATGERKWQNINSGDLAFTHPHGGPKAKSGVAGQGYLLASEKRIVVPTGRAIPGGFQRSDGDFSFWRLAEYWKNGGTRILMQGNTFVNDGMIFDLLSGEMIGQPFLGGKVQGKKGHQVQWPRHALPMAATQEGLVVWDDQGNLHALKWVQKKRTDHKGADLVHRELQKAWEKPGLHGGAALAVAGGTLISGGDGFVDLVNLETQEKITTLKVEGKAFGLAVASGQLVVSTDKGHLFCFDKGGSGSVKHRPIQNEQVSSMETEAAVLLKKSGMDAQSRGCILDVGCEDGQLALALAEQTQCTVIAVGRNAEAVSRARKLAAQKGVYGSRVSILFREHLDIKGFPDYMANLVVSQRSLKSGAKDLPMEDMRRVQKPHGGILQVGSVFERRKPLAGEGSWTHGYADTGNTLCSGDTFLKGPLSMLWFRAFDKSAYQPARITTPLYAAGRLFYQSTHGVLAVDAYNGAELWHYHQKDLLPSSQEEIRSIVHRIGPNACLFGNSLFLRHGDTCVRVNVQTGKKETTYQAPRIWGDQKPEWGLLYVLDGVLVGSVLNQEHVAVRGNNMFFNESKGLFALDVKTGKKLWDYTPKYSIRTGSLALGNNKVFLIDKQLALFDRYINDKNEKMRQLKKAQQIAESKKQKSRPGILKALDLKTGKEVWKVDQDIFGPMLIYSKTEDVLLMSGKSDGVLSDRRHSKRMAAYSGTKGGQPLWSETIPHRVRPILNGNIIYTARGGRALLTGESIKKFNFRRGHGCGMLSSSAHLMVFRSSNLGYVDLSGKGELQNYGGFRPGCMLGTIPAGGLVLAPNSSMGCDCSYQNKTWMALRGRR